MHWWFGGHPTLSLQSSVAFGTWRSTEHAPTASSDPSNSTALLISTSLYPAPAVNTALEPRRRVVLRQGMPSSLVRTAQVSLAEALAKGPPPPGNLAVPIFSHGSLEVELYTPGGEDRQQPHDRDEVYLVARGTGWFFDGARRQAVEAGAFIFVAAGQRHRFEDFTADFAVWVLFYGPPVHSDG
jgi:mannose-6-phosphate isomerase-like protein (cupin superfamily)